jgi:hypothetical protein
MAQHPLFYWRVLVVILEILDFVTTGHGDMASLCLTLTLTFILLLTILRCRKVMKVEIF